MRLNEENIDFFLPITKSLRVWNDRKKYISVPLFPSYIFVHLSNKTQYYSALDIDGVLQYVRLGKEIARVSDKIIRDIRLMMNCSEQVSVYEDHFLPGQQLLVTEGPLTGLSCEVVSHNGVPNLLVRVNLLKRNLLVKLPATSLMPIGNSHTSV